MRTEEQKRRNSTWTVEYNKRRRVQRNAWLREWNKKNPEQRFMRYFRHRLKTRYGLTPDQYNAMLESQGGLCLICQKELHVTTTEDRERHGGSATVDHDANTGRVRGILCNNCNRAIGLLEHDIPTMQRAIAYLDGK